MLSSRYLHLHEALGLGPMWLKQGAKVLAATPAAAAGTAPAARKPEPQTAPKPVPSAAPAADARARLAEFTHRPDASPTAGRAAPNGGAAHRPSEHPAAAEPVIDVSGIRPADVMVVSVCPAPEDHLAGQLFSGSVGVLLDNMLSAIGLTPEQAHKTVWLKTADIAARPDETQIQAALPQMQAELAASRARAVLLLGQAFTPQQAAVQILSVQARCFHIPHPARLLRQPQLKRQAWEELQKLQQFLEQAV